MSGSGHIVEIVKSWDGGGLIARLRRHGPKIPRPKKHEDLYLLRDMGEGEARLERISPGTTGPGTLPNGAALARVRTDAQPLDCAFTGLLKDTAGHDWDLVFRGKFTVVEPRKFLREHAIKAMAVGSSLTCDGMQSWMLRTLRKRIADEVSRHSMDDLRQKDALPQRWWQDHLAQWLESYGIDIALADVLWDSADAQRAEAERRRLEHETKLEEQRRQQREVELRESQERTEYETERGRLESDRQLTAAQRQHQLRLLEERHRHEALAANMQIEQARWSHEQAALEHELTMARLRQDLAATQNLRQREHDGQLRHRQQMQAYAEAQQTHQRLSAMNEPLLVSLAHPDPMTAHQAAERLTSPEFGISPEALESMGYDLSSQAFVSRMRQRQSASRHTVTLRMKDLTTRDIGVNPVRVNALPIGSSLQFELTSTMAGYVTLINIGTSGKVWLQIPGPHVAPEAAYIQAGSLYTVPGPALLPLESIGGYYENGPVGWEHMAITVTDIPIVDPKYLSLATPEMPFIDLTSEAAAELAASLEEPAVGEYAVGLLSFLVQ